MKELPKVYQNPINKRIKIQDTFYSNYKNDELKYNINELNKKINEIFASRNHVYKSRVLIRLKDKEIYETIIGKTENNLLTMDGKLIRISDILDIKKI